jgi:hypothetical protein
MTHSDPAMAASARLAPLWWPLALLAILAPTLLAAHDPPSVTFYNQVLAVCGWGLFIAALSRAPSGRVASNEAGGVRSLSLLLLLHAGLAAGSGLFGQLAGGAWPRTRTGSRGFLWRAGPGWRDGHGPGLGPGVQTRTG